MRPIRNAGAWDRTPILVRWDQVSQAAYLDYMEEWEASGQKIVPGASDRRGRTFDQMRDLWAEADSALPNAGGAIRSTQYFLQGENGCLLGAISLRHSLNDRLTVIGGHIGFGVRPSQRRRGWGKAMLGALLQSLPPDRYPQVLVTCDDDNAASAATIEACGGVLEDRRDVEGVRIRRYWISPGEVQGTRST